jgi:hypothetical protein
MALVPDEDIIEEFGTIEKFKEAEAEPTNECEDFICSTQLMII